MLRRNIQLILFLLFCAAITLALAPHPRAQREPLSVNKSAPPWQPGPLENSPLKEVLNTVRAALPNRYLSPIGPAEPVVIFTVTTTADNGSNASPTPGSLREAIVNANNSGGGTINFNIPASDPNCNATTHVCTITIVTRPLPDITAPVTIDGYTQPGASTNSLDAGDNAVLLVELNGNGVSGANGLSIDIGNCTVRGLVINGFNVNGIALYESAATNTHIEGNFIGTDATGTVANSNGNAGIYFQRANGNQIGGTSPAARNIISGNINYGILIENGGGVAGAGNIIQGNYVGTNAAGTAAVPNGAVALQINNCQNNLVGGIAAGARNLISGNLNHGISMLGDGPPASGNVVQGNFIGTDISGTLALGNAQRGISITSVGGHNTIGGTTAEARNVISANAAGVWILLGSESNTVQGNFIGVGADGTTVLGNHGDGVRIIGNNNLIGGAAAGAGNVIAYSGTPGQNDGGDGVFVYDGTGNSISGNSMFANGNPGYQFSERGFALASYTPLNDNCDADTGANNLQNFPVLTSATSNGTTTTIEGTLNSTPGTSFRIEFFASDACHQSGFGEGKTFLGAATV